MALDSHSFAGKRQEVSLQVCRAVCVLFALVAAPLHRSAAQEPPAHTSALHGFLFGDVVYVAREQAATEGFFIGQTVAHGNVQLSSRVTFFGEVSATARSESYALEMERAILRYDFVDQFKLSAGRYHTPISYWNTAFHHGLWLQTSVTRPEMVKVGGRFIPVHFVGLMAEGNLAANRIAFSYELGIGNGRGANVARGGDAGDVDDRRAVVGAVKIRPGDSGLQLGGSVYFDRIAVGAPAAEESTFYEDSNLAATWYDERIASAHVVWDRGRPEVIVEYSNVEHDAADGTEYVSEGWYAHAALTLPGPWARWKPFARFERLHSDEVDPVFDAVVADYRAFIGGVRYDFDGLAALKGEYRRERFADGPSVNGLYLQVAFAIPLSRAM